VGKALQAQKAVVVAVADSHGELIGFARMDGAPVSSIRIAINKARNAARARKPTQEIGEKVRHPEEIYDIAYYGDSNHRKIKTVFLALLRCDEKEFPTCHPEWAYASLGFLIR
jgi:hypothetical protein